MPTTLHLTNHAGSTEVAIIGAGPYGLSIAAHLNHLGIPLRIFGRPMQSWKNHMPQGMCLKSEGFASNLYDPLNRLTLKEYCKQHRHPYSDVGHPVPLEIFSAYGAEFQRQLVPQLETTDVNTVVKGPDVFNLTLANGESVQARRVIVAAGISHFGYLPPILQGHSEEWVTQSYDHAELSRFHGRNVTVVGGGASAIDLAAALHQTGAEVQVIARRQSIAFHSPPRRRSILDKIRSPRSGLGTGWKSWMCTYAPWLFYSLPLNLRIRAVERHLGPAPGWFVREQVEGKVPLILGATLKSLKVQDGKIHLAYERAGAAPETLTTDHVIGATGYRVHLDRLEFLAPEIRQQVRRVQDSPELSRNFESSVPGLYFTGLASALNYGPLMRFACGAEYTSRTLAKHFQSLTRHSVHTKAEPALS